MLMTITTEVVHWGDTAFGQGVAAFLGMLGIAAITWAWNR